MKEQAKKQLRDKIKGNLTPQVGARKLFAPPRGLRHPVVNRVLDEYSLSSLHPLLPVLVPASFPENLSHLAFETAIIKEILLSLQPPQWGSSLLREWWALFQHVRATIPTGAKFVSIYVVDWVPGVGLFWIDYYYTTDEVDRTHFVVVDKCGNMWWSEDTKTIEVKCDGGVLRFWENLLGDVVVERHLGDILRDWVRIWDVGVKLVESIERGLKLRGRLGCLSKPAAQYVLLFQDVSKREMKRVLETPKSLIRRLIVK